MIKNRKTFGAATLLALSFISLPIQAEIDIVSDYTTVLDQKPGQFHFRGLVLGQPCEQSVPFELKRQSTPVAPLLSSDFSYTGYYLNQLWDITYHCSEDGTLEKGSYSLQLKHEEEAKGFFNAVKNSLNRDLGLPQFDSSDPVTRGHLARIGGFAAEAIAPTVLWENGIYSTTLRRTSAYKHRVLVTIKPVAINIVRDDLDDTPVSTQTSELTESPASPSSPVPAITPSVKPIGQAQLFNSAKQRQPKQIPNTKPTARIFTP